MFGDVLKPRFESPQLGKILPNPDLFEGSGGVHVPDGWEEEVEVKSLTCPPKVVARGNST